MNRTIKQFFDINQKTIYVHSENEDYDKCSISTHGTDMIELTEEHIKALKNGKYLLIPENDGEYQMIIRFKNKTT